jgi:hypothetical protein
MKAIQSEGTRHQICCFIANSSPHSPPIHALEEKRRSQKTHTSCYCPIPRRLELPKNGLHTYMALSYFPKKPKLIVSQPLKAQPSPPFACLPDNHTPDPCYYLRRRPQSRRFTPARTPDTITCAIASKRYHGQENNLKKLLVPLLYLIFHLYLSVLDLR